MSSNTNELATAELVDRGLDALKSREYRQALQLWEEVHRRHPDHPRATRLVQELRAWLERRNTVKPRTDRPESTDAAPPNRVSASEAAGDLHRVERRIRDLEQRLESTVRRKSELLDEINDLHTHYREREEELQRTSDKRIQRLNEEISEYRDGDERLRQQQLETSQELVRFERERDDAQLRSNSLLDEIEKERRSNEDLRVRLEDLREEQTLLRTELAAFDKDEIEELREIAETVGPLQRELRDAHQTITNLEDAQAQLQTELMDAEARAESTEETRALDEERLLARLEESEDNHRKIASRLDETLRQLKAASETNESLSEQLDAERANHTEQTDRLTEFERRNETLVGQLKAVEERLAALVPDDDVKADQTSENVDPFDISSLLEDEEEFRAEFANESSDDDQDGEPESEEVSHSLENSDDDQDGEPESEEVSHSDEDSDSEDMLNFDSLDSGELLDFDKPDVPSEPDQFSPEEPSEGDSEKEDLTTLLGASMDTLFEEDDGFVDLDAPSSESYGSPSDVEFELVDPDKNPGYSGEFEALLMNTPDLVPASDDEKASGFSSLSNQPDAVVNPVKDTVEDESELTPMSAFVLSRIDQQVRVGELIDTMGLPASKTISCLEELVERGFITVEA